MGLVKPARQIASLSVDFLVIGAGIAGLACAIALRRVGHRVVVLEKHDSITKATGGCRMPPNLSKILFHWGLEKELRKISLKSQGIALNLFETGELLGEHIWDEELLRESRGEFVFAHHADLRQLLYDTALSCGATIHLNTTVAAVEPEACRVRLSTGEVLEADVIVGADGPSGLSRLLFDQGESVHRMNMYSATIPKELIVQDEDLSFVYDGILRSMFAWFGDGRSVLGFPAGGKADFALFIYCPKDGNEGSWEEIAPLSAMQEVLETAEPRLKKLGKLAQSPTCIAFKEVPDLDDWVHESGPLVLVGEAAHPLPPGSIQEAALAIEDGAVLGKLFSHLHSRSQIRSLLYAFHEIRNDRCSRVTKKEIGDIQFMCLPPGDYQQMRDDVMRAKRDAGKDVLDSDADTGEEEEKGKGVGSAEWAEIVDVFGYDAEDDADNWWVMWGLLRERAREDVDIAPCNVMTEQVVEFEQALAVVDSEA